MILLTALLIALILTTAAIIVPMIFHYKTSWLRYVVIFGLAFSLSLGVAAISIVNGANNTAAWLQEESADILLYYNTINYSDNEYVRYNFYDRVMEYNRAYEAYQEATENPWLSWLYDVDVLSKCGPIDFMLNAGTYG